MEYSLENIAVVIPALNPCERLVELVKKLRSACPCPIILVDDGSEIKNRTFFNTCKQEYSCKVIRHVVNFGKGMALKSAFNHILDNCPDIYGAVTADCDGQHTPEDIIRCANLILEHPDRLILGVRQFDDKNIPLRSRFGNKATRTIIKLLCGIKVDDTQTGLRGMSKPLLKEHFANTKGERFEYEMNMLLEAKENDIELEQFPIKTIYIENNESSHFNPFIDSIRIYKVFLKFLLSSLSSFLIDIVLFYLLGLFFRLFISEKTQVNFYFLTIPLITLLRSVLSRLGSSLYNYTINKKHVFNSNTTDSDALIRYYLLCVCQLILSTVFVEYTFTFIGLRTIRKCIVDTLLFVISFQIQREWVFKKRKPTN